MDAKQFKKVIELLERNNELLEAIGRSMIQETEANAELVDRLLNKPKKSPFASYENQKMVQLARANNEETDAQLARTEAAINETTKKLKRKHYPGP